MWTLSIWKTNTSICKASQISRVISKGKYTDPITLVLHDRALKRKVNKKHQSTKRQAVINIWSWYELVKKNHWRLKFISLCTLLSEKIWGAIPYFIPLSWLLPFFFPSLSLSEKAGKYFDTESINRQDLERAQQSVFHLLQVKCCYAQVTRLPAIQGQRKSPQWKIACALIKEK